MNNLVTVIIPTFNRCALLPEAVESVLNQTYKKTEIIVVDDGSKDDTAKVVKGYGDKVKYVYQENAGLSAALNTGIKNASGEFIAFLDDDDFWHPTMVEQCAGRLIEAADDVGVAYVAYRFFRGDDKENLIEREAVQPTGDIFPLLLRKSFIPVNTVLVRRECIETAGAFDESLKGYMDWDLLLRISFEGFKFSFIDTPLAFIRIHGVQMSSNLLMMKRSALRVVEKIAAQPRRGERPARLIRRTLARKHLSLGWYLALNNERDEGRRELRKAMPVDGRQALQRRIALLLTALPGNALLPRLNTLIESLFGQKNPYRDK